MIIKILELSITGRKTKWLTTKVEPALLKGHETCCCKKTRSETNRLRLKTLRVILCTHARKKDKLVPLHIYQGFLILFIMTYHNSVTILHKYCEMCSDASMLKYICGYSTKGLGPNPCPKGTWMKK
jgi:hypothetical protein